MLKHARGALLQYSLALPPLAVQFDFNPRTISRTRTVSLAQATPGGRGYPFRTPADVTRVGQGVTAQPETLSIQALFDGADRLADGDPVVALNGIQPELSALRLMAEPKGHAQPGVQLLAGLGFGSKRALERVESASVVLFIWGVQVLPVFITSVKIDELAHLPNLQPYRAEATVGMQVIDGDNPFYQAELVRQMAAAALGTAGAAGGALGDTAALFGGLL